MSAEHIQSLSLSSDQLAQEHLPLAAQGLAHLLKGLQTGRLSIHFDDGQSIHIEGRQSGLHAHWHLHRPARLLQRVVSSGNIGLAEGYLEGDWSSPDLASLLHLGALNMDAMLPHLSPGWFQRVVHRIQHLCRPNSKRGSRRNIAAHYDLGNAFYQLWLDPGMTYSSALYTQEGMSLADAQEAKYARLLTHLDAHPGQRILEIGCGWGGFAEHAARQGFELKGITLSKEQLAYAQARLHAAGFSSHVQLSLTDYRDLNEQFDHIVSIEMFEAVGEKYWPDFFTTVYQRLKPGGRAAIQVIVIDDALFEHYRTEPDYIQLYVFPGGMLPTVERFKAESVFAGLEVVEHALFGLDYARTLAEWHERFESQLTSIDALGYDERFKRMWRYYLAYCEAGFRAGRIDLMQIILQKPI